MTLYFCDFSGGGDGIRNFCPSYGSGYVRGSRYTGRLLIMHGMYLVESVFYNSTEDVKRIQQMIKRSKSCNYMLGNVQVNVQK